MDEQLAREAKAIVALAFRNGPIENIHAGDICPTCSRDRRYSHISQEEMKVVMKNAADQVYWLIRLRKEDPEQYERQIEFGNRYTRQWDPPDEQALRKQSKT